MKYLYESLSSILESSRLGRPVQVIINPEANLIEKNCIKKDYPLDAMAQWSLSILGK